MPAKRISEKRTMEALDISRHVKDLEESENPMVGVVGQVCADLQRMSFAAYMENTVRQVP